MVTYAANLSNVGEVAAEMGAIGSYITQMLDDLESSSQADLAHWTSSAREAYNTAVKVWTQKCAEMSQQAAKAQQSLSDISNAYAQAEYLGLGLFGGGGQ
jgi:ESAT-6 family protein